MLVRLFFTLFAVHLGSQLNDLADGLLVFELVLLQIPEIGLESLVNLHLDKFLERLVVLRLQLNVVLLGDQQLMAGELLLVQLKLLLEGWQLIHLFSLGLLQLLDDRAALVLLLLDRKFEVLSLGVEDLAQLLLFRFQLINLFFHFFKFTVEF